MAKVEWRIPEGAAEVSQQAGARLQHEFSLLIKRRLLEQEVSVREFCFAAKKSYDRMLRVLNGQMVMKLEDIGVTDVLLGKIAGIASGNERSAARQQLGLRDLNS